MLTRSLLLSVLLAITTGCPARGGGSGDDDDDDGGGGSSTAWLVIDNQDDDGDGGTTWDQQILVQANYPNVCAQTRALYDLWDELDAYELQQEAAIEDEFGSLEAPGARQAVCELRVEVTRRLFEANHPAYREGTEEITFQFYPPDGEEPSELPPGEYAHREGFETPVPSFYGGTTRVLDMSYYEAGGELDCSDPDAYDDWIDGAEGIQLWEDWESESGTVWVSAPDDSTRALTTEDLVFRNWETEETESVSFEFEGSECFIDRNTR